MRSFIFFEYLLKANQFPLHVFQIQHMVKQRSGADPCWSKRTILIWGWIISLTNILGPLGWPRGLRFVATESGYNKAFITQNQMTLKVHLISMIQILLNQLNSAICSKKYSFHQNIKSYETDSSDHLFKTVNCIIEPPTVSTNIFVFF
jgi:hypothetical protein